MSMWQGSVCAFVQLVEASHQTAARNGWQGRNIDTGVFSIDLPTLPMHVADVVLTSLHSLAPVCVPWQRSCSFPSKHSAGAAVGLWAALGPERFQSAAPGGETDEHRAGSVEMPDAWRMMSSSVVRHDQPCVKLEPEDFSRCCAMPDAASDYRQPRAFASRCWMVFVICQAWATSAMMLMPA